MLVFCEIRYAQIECRDARVNFFWIFLHFNMFFQYSPMFKNEFLRKLELVNVNL
jgi:hypothetical protein